MAGRPRIMEKPRALTILLNEQTFLAIERLRGRASRAEYIRRVLNKHIQDMIEFYKRNDAKHSRPAEVE